VALSTHLGYADPANLAAVTWRIQDVCSDGTSALLLNDSPLSAPQPVNITAAQFAQVTIGPVTSSHDIWAIASDGTYSSAPVHFTVSPPLASVASLASGQSAPSAQDVTAGIFIKSNPSGDNFAFEPDLDKAAMTKGILEPRQLDHGSFTVDQHWETALFARDDDAMHVFSPEHTAADLLHYLAHFHIL
jgi:hypothetical protein